MSQQGGGGDRDDCSRADSTKTTEDGYQREVKVVMVGETGVGKSSLTLRFVSNNFKEHSQATIGASFLSKTIFAKELVKFNIWDTAGQEKYRSLASLYYRGVDCAIVVYDITSKASFNEVANYWMQELKHQCYGAKGLQICIVGNKSDMPDKRQVSTEDGQQLADEFGALFFETSAKLNSNINEVFIRLAELLPEEEMKANSDASSSTANRTAYKVKMPERDSGCC